MRFRMRHNSLFAILLRSPWWISFLVAAAIGLVARVAMPAQYANYAWFAGGPFIVIGCIAGYKQLFTIGRKRAAHILDAVAAMSWSEFASVVSQSFQREGYVVTRLAGPAADFEISQDGKSAVVCCKRWKAAAVGVEPLRELKAVAESRGAAGKIYIAMGEVSDTAQKFASANHIDVLQGQRLAQLLREVPGGKKPA